MSERDTTDLMVEQGWTLKKPLKAKIQSSLLIGLPDPVVIIYRIPRKDNKGKVIYLTEENRQRYGKLLDGYAEVLDRGPV